MNSAETIHISTSTILRTILILLGLVFLYLIKDILMIVFVAVIIAAAVSGPAGWMQKHKVPRLLGVIFVYLFLFLILAFIVSLILPSLAEQIKLLSENFPEFMEKISLSVQEFWQGTDVQGNLQSFLNAASNRLSGASSNVFGAIVGLFGGIFSALIVLVISFYLSMQEKGVRSFLISVVPGEHQHYTSDLIERIQKKIGGWLRGQLLLMLIIGILTYIGLYFLGVKYALTFALLAGLLEIVPYVGPIIAAIPAVILGFLQSPMLGLLVVLLYVVIQQLENYIIVPQVMKKTVGLNPIVIIVVMLIGSKLAGVMGLILAVPFTAGAAEFVKDLRKKGS